MMTLRKTVSILGLISMLAHCNSVQHYHDKTVIDWHNGGVVWKVYAELQNYTKPIEIRGWCASCCTLALEFKDTCVYRNATLLFHAPRLAQLDSRGNIVISKGWFKIMLESYPANIKPIFKQTLDGKDYVYTGEYLHTHYGVPLCK